MPNGSPPESDAPSGQEEADIAGIVLAGGASRRMGRDKATLRLPPATAAGGGRDETLLGRAARHLAEAGASRIIVATGTVGRLGELPWEEVGDGIHAGRGPLAGLAAALDALTGTVVALVLAVDIPFASPPLLRWLADEVRITGASGLIPVSPGPEGRPQPLHAAYRPDPVAPTLRRHLETNDLRVLRALASAGALQVDVPLEVARRIGADWHRNANSPLDVRGLRE